MSCWPIFGSEVREIPSPGSPGSFWEDRGDRRHCGIDLYGHCGSKVRAIEGGNVLDIGIQTSPEWSPYWNTTYYLIIRQNNRLLVRYAELGDYQVEKGVRVKECECIGHIGQVINTDNVDNKAPAYIHQLKDAGRICMLHLEVYASLPSGEELYMGGNWYGKEAPEYIRDPAVIFGFL